MSVQYLKMLQVIVSLNSCRSLKVNLYKYEDASNTITLEQGWDGEQIDLLVTGGTIYVSIKKNALQWNLLVQPIRQVYVTDDAVGIQQNFFILKGGVHLIV